MYNIDNTIKYKVINVITGEKSVWFDNQIDLVKHIAKASGCTRGIAGRSINSYRYALEHVKNTLKKEVVVSYISGPGLYDLKKVVFEKELLVVDNYYRIITLRNLENVYYNTRDLRYDFKNPLIYDLDYRRYWNKKKKLREKDSGFRKEPVSWTRKRKGGSPYRRIKYKDTLLAYTDLECSEYKIKPYRRKNVLNAWDIEAWESGSKNWKENRKVKRQWMIHLDKKDKEVRKQINMVGMNEEEIKE